MEDKIENGEYVRTKNGIIGTLIEISKAGSGVRYAGEFITDTIISIYTKPHTEVRLKERDIVNHSKNIIKLIEVGDYVNGYLVVAISDDGYIEIAIGDDIEQGELLTAEDIKSIVTKEQFKSVEYKV